MTDQLERYLLHDKSARIQSVDLSHAWQTGLAHQQLPSVVQALLGELTAAAALLANNRKFDGALILQIQGDGPLSLLVAECDANLTIRATATLQNEAVIHKDASLQELVNQHGDGRFIVVLDPRNEAKGMQPYQGIVNLEGDSIAEMLQNYLKTSEQLDSRLCLAANDERAVGLLLQRLPTQGGHDTPTESAAETWETLNHLVATVKHQELLETPARRLLRQLFWEQELFALEPVTLQWFCPCSRKRVAEMLKMLGQAEVQEIEEEQGEIEVVCNFCGQPYVFDSIDLHSLFTDASSLPPSDDPTVH